MSAMNLQEELINAGVDPREAQMAVQPYERWTLTGGSPQPAQFDVSKVELIASHKYRSEILIRYRNKAGQLEPLIFRSPVLFQPFRVDNNLGGKPSFQGYVPNEDAPAFNAEHRSFLTMCEQLKEHMVYKLDELLLQDDRFRAIFTQITSIQDQNSRLTLINQTLSSIAYMTKNGICIRSTVTTLRPSNLITTQIIELSDTAPPKRIARLEEIGSGNEIRSLFKLSTVYAAKNTGMFYLSKGVMCVTVKRPESDELAQSFIGTEQVAEISSFMGI